ncbi:MAG: MBL fold metallo-hydrolase [Candidatus Thorarchaeota archaeon]
MTKISFLGSCREIGRSCILIESEKGSKCLLDYGIGFNNDNRLPLEADFSNLKSIALTHSHIDHSGALPFIYKKNKIPFFTNSISLEIAEILIRDMIKISKFPYPFGFRELDLLLIDFKDYKTLVRILAINLHKLLHQVYHLEITFLI